MIHDNTNRTKLVGLLRFKTNKSEDPISFKQ